MHVIERAVYVGPNLYANFRVIRLTLDLGPLEEWPTGRLGPAFVEGLLDALPGLRRHGCSYAKPGGFLRRLTEPPGTWLGHVLEHTSIELQNIAGLDVTYGKTRSADAPGVYDVVYEYRDEDVGVEAGELARTLLLSLLPSELRPADEVPPGFAWADARDGFIRSAQDRAFGPSTRALVDAAEQRGIPWIRLNRQSLVQFGHGRYQQRIQASVTSGTRHIGVALASDKEETNRLLADLGIPVAPQRLVYDAEAAVQAAESLGYPVVTKPIDANHGRGVSIRLTDADGVRRGFLAAREHAAAVLVESFVPGDDHRLLVVGGRMIAAARRVPGHVTGNGEHTIAELVDIVNQDPRRGIGHEKVLTRIEIDLQARQLLELCGMTPETVPPCGEKVFLRATGNLSSGGTAIDVTDVVHPDNVAMAERAARAIGLDVCGVDYLSADVAQSFQAVGGAICEVNAAPGLRMHVAPSAGRPRDVATPIVEMLFPVGSPSRIPIAAITGTNGKTTTARMLGHVLKMSGRTVGMTTTDGVYIDGNLTVPGDMTGPFAAQIVLRDPTVDAAVLETARGGLLRRGMAFRNSDVGACLNVQGDHLGRHRIETIEELAKVKRIVIETARDTTVLNADDAQCLSMAGWSHADHLCYVTTDAHHELVKEHIRAGGRACVLEEGITGAMIVFYDNGAHIPVILAHEIPATLDGRAFHNVQNAMFAAVMAFSMRVPLDDLRQGLRTFDSSFYQVPGRTNVYSELPFQVVLDYGHNPAAVRALVHMCDQIAVEGRKICVLSAPGDRRDQDVRAIAEACAGHFDHVVCRRDDDLRGRGPTEIPELLRDALLDRGVRGDSISIVPAEVDAIESALAMARRGDLLLVFGDQVRRCWQQIQQHLPITEIPMARPARRTVPQPRLASAASQWSVGLDTTSLVRDRSGVRLPRVEPVEEGD